MGSDVADKAVFIKNEHTWVVVRGSLFKPIFPIKLHTFLANRRKMSLESRNDELRI